MNCPLCGDDLDDPRSLTSHLPQCPVEIVDEDRDDGRDDRDDPRRRC
jgi:hypothetical protein